MNKSLIAIIIVLTGLCIGCDPQGDKTREEIEQIADSNSAV